MPKIGDVVMRYPGGDPENGPAYRQRWNGKQWECAKHDFILCEEVDEETGVDYSYTACKHCGGYIKWENVV